MSITLLGLGNCGSQIAKQISQNFKGINFKIIDTNNQNKALEDKNCLFLGNGRGSGMNPTLALQLGKAKQTEIESFIKTPELLFLVAGVGGTGNGLADHLAISYSSKKTLPISYIVKPFEWETDRLGHFEKLLVKLRKNNYSYMVIDNQKIANKYKDLPVDEVYSQANKVLEKSLKTIENLKDSGDVDLNDIKTVLSYPGYFLANTVKANTWQEAIDNIVDDQLVDFQLETFQGVILRVSGSKLPTQADTQNFIKFLNSKKDSGKSKYIFQKTDQEGIQIDLILTGINNNIL